MTTEQRAAATAELIRALSNEQQPHGLTKPELRAAVDAADAWCNSNAAAFNSALPTPARTILTSAQKARLLAWVALHRHTHGA
jgi:hypothetical protein